jgi:hypothetical protein
MNCIKAQSFQWVNDTVKNYLTPIGEGQYEELKSSEFWQEMEIYGNAYQIKDSVIEKINFLLKKHIIIDVVFGGWCGDSKEWIPALMKVIRKIDKINSQEIRWIGVSRDKKSGDTDITELNVEKYPTIIFYVEGEEIGRIIETPALSIEEDIVKMLEK